MKQEDSVDFKQTFNVDFPEIQLPQQRSRKTKYIKLGIILTTIAAIITTVVLLVCHYKYGLFQSEIYQVTNIKRELYSEEYYTETKTIKSKLSYTSGELEERVQKIENVKDIEIIKKGIEQPGIDTTKYYIRILFNDNIYFDFGESVYLMTIHEKYKQCVAVIKEIVVPDMVSNDYNNEEEFNEN